MKRKGSRPAKVLTAAIQKGGTGKTTTAAALAQAAASKGRRALAVDLDPQGSLTYALAGRTDALSSLDLLQGAEPGRTIQKTPQGVDLIPASWELSTIRSGRGSALRLQRALEPLRSEYDIIVIDTPPTAGELQYNALQACTGLVIPLLADAFGIQALYQIAETAKQFRRTNEGLRIEGVVITQYDRRSLIARKMAETIEEKAGLYGIPLLGTVRSSVAIREAEALGRSIYEYAPQSNPAVDYLAIYQKIMKE